MSEIARVLANGGAAVLTGLVSRKDTMRFKSHRGLLDLPPGSVIGERLSKHGLKVTGYLDLTSPALAQADVGMAMGRAGTDIAIEASHVALMRDDWRMVPLAIRIARRTYGTIKQNVLFGVAFNVAAMGLAAIGILTPVLASAAQAMPDVLVSLNSSRLLRLE